jgi:hypothetical protein
MWVALQQAAAGGFAPAAPPSSSLCSSASRSSAVARARWSAERPTMMTRGLISPVTVRAVRAQPTPQGALVRYKDPNPTRRASRSTSPRFFQPASLALNARTRAAVTAAMSSGPPVTRTIASPAPAPAAGWPIAPVSSTAFSIPIRRNGCAAPLVSRSASARSSRLAERAPWGPAWELGSCRLARSSMRFANGGQIPQVLLQAKPAPASNARQEVETRRGLRVFPTSISGFTRQPNGQSQH